MADVKFQTVRVTLNNVTGTQDITISGFGTPKAAIFYLSSATTDDTISAQADIAIGYTDGTNQAAVGTRDVDNSATSMSGRQIRNDAVIIDLTTTSLDIKANFDSWITDGVRVNITNAASSRFVTVVLIGGADVTDAKVESTQLTSTSNDITTIGFEPDVVFINSVGDSSINPGSNSAHSIISNGVAVNDGGDSNCGVFNFQENGQATSDTGQWVSSTHSVGQYFNGSLTWGGAIGSYDSSGFTITTSASTGNDYVCYLALKFQNSPLLNMSIEDSPTSTGSKHFGSLSSTPDFHMMLTSNASALTSSSNGVGFSVYVGDLTNQYTTGISSQDAVATTVSKTISSSGRLQQLFNGAKEFDSTFTSFDSTGANYNFTTVDGTPRKWASLFIGAGAVGGVSIPVIMNQLRNQGIN